MYLTPSHRRLLWLDSCTSRLLELQPRLDVDEAWACAETLLDDKRTAAPEAAAESFSRDVASAHGFGFFKTWVRNGLGASVAGRH